MTDISFRDLSSMAEFRAAEDLQRAVWGEGDLPDPADLMMVIQDEGGLIGGERVGGAAFGHAQVGGHCGIDVADVASRSH